MRHALCKGICRQAGARPALASALSALMVVSVALEPSQMSSRGGNVMLSALTLHREMVC